jgi:hypothetical protein
MGCFGGRDRPTVPVFGDLFVRSDPSNADIIIDGQSLGVRTPALLPNAPVGFYEVELVLVATPEQTFAWADTTTVSEGVRDTLDVGLEGGCRSNCPFQMQRGRIDCRFTGLGDTCAGAFFGGGPGLSWPDTAVLEYAAGGRILAAAILGSDAGASAGDTVASQVALEAWTGREPLATRASGFRQIETVEYWATEPGVGESLLGLSVKQTIVAIDTVDVEDILFIRYEVENVSGDPRYRRNYPSVPEGGYTFEQLYLGFGLDADVGVSTDDLGTFDPDLNLGFLYDADFSDPALGGFSDSPALVGLVSVEPPAGSTERTLTLWRAGDDWNDQASPGFGWRVLAGRLGTLLDPIGDHPSPDIGFVSDAPDDYRLTEGHGPLTLAPGDTASLTVALVLGAPVPGAYTPGQQVDPGDPLDSNRQILTIAQRLRTLAAAAPTLWLRFRP